VPKFTYELHPGQVRAFDSEAQYVAMIAGTGGGKTWFGSIWLAREIKKDVKADYLAVAPTYPMLKDILLPRALEILNDWHGGTYKSMEKVYYLKGGGRVLFRSADRPLSMEGVHVNAVWLDEAGQMRSEAWHVAQRRVGFHKGRILITTTPYFLNWLKTDIYDRWKEGDPAIDVIQFGTAENPYYPREQIEVARRTMPDWMFRMFYLGEFVKPEGLVYQDFDAGIHIIEPLELPSNWRRIIGMDFGYNNPMAAVWLAIDDDGNVYAYREYYERRKLPQDVASDLARLSKGEQIDAILVDPSAPVLIEELRRQGFNAISANNAVKEGIAAVTGLLREKRLFFFRGLSNTLDEIESYHWKKVNDQIKEEPEKEYDHAMDALRYGIIHIVENIEKRSPKGIDVLRGVKIYGESV